jgi:AraC family transcriptional regulator, regulatory protein of adaptative response / methylated-DNA-[protein]-cysteine methyltransferase
LFAISVTTPKKSDSKASFGMSLNSALCKVTYCNDGRRIMTATQDKTSLPSTPADNPVFWEAVTKRDPAFDGQFFYSVKTTGVFCRPSCAARLANPKNVAFHANVVAAQDCGFRACKRCKPDQASQTVHLAQSVEKACRFIEANETMPSLADLASHVGLSAHHFHRVFKTTTGLTPRAYALAHRNTRLHSQLPQSGSVTEAIYDAGFSSSSRFYETSSQMLGMKPRAFKRGGEGMVIQFALAQCSLGSILIATTKIGVCAILLGDTPEPLLVDLQDRFPNAELRGDEPNFEASVAHVIALVEQPRLGHELPVDVRGTAFQRRVWQALTNIPVGTTKSYSEIADDIGEPRAARAVAQACGANPLAVAIPCHRVVRNNGDLSGYRWGVSRKEAILAREKPLASMESVA